MFLISSEITLVNEFLVLPRFLFSAEIREQKYYIYK